MASSTVPASSSGTVVLHPTDAIIFAVMPCPALPCPVVAASIKIMYEPQPTPRAVEGLLGVTVKQVGRGLHW
jgi:hypothetical protein